MATVNVDSPIQIFTGDWVKAGDYANLIGAPVQNGQVTVPDTTWVQVPGGGTMTAGAIDYSQTVSYPMHTPEPGGGTAPPDGTKPSGGTDPIGQQNEATRQQSAIDYAKANFPWAYQLGLADLIVGAVQRGVTNEGLVAEIRNSSQYKQRFVGINRDDGTMRMNEADYLRREDDYRTVLKDAGLDGHLTGNPSDYLALFQNDIDPNELKTRTDTYSNIERGGQDVKDAFYVYAGMHVSTDDLYKAVVEPDAMTKLQQQYNQQVAAQPLDYQTWITRATEAGLQRVSNTLTDLQQQGTLGTVAAQQITSLDPQFARQLMDSLYNGVPGAGTVQRPLSLDELQHAFQYALLGSAATANGLALPDVGRLEALRQAGVDRAKALQGYGQIATNQNLWQGELARAGLGPMDQSGFERGVLLGTGAETDALKRAQAYEDSLGQRSGAASFQTKNGLLQQQGLVPTGT